MTPPADAVWPLLDHIAGAHPGFSAAQLYAAPGVPGHRDGDRWAFRLMRDCEGRGWVRRSRPSGRGPWLWEMTPAGRLALSAHQEGRRRR